jgi:hypothetical protein
MEWPLAYFINHFLNQNILVTLLKIHQCLNRTLVRLLDFIVRLEVLDWMGALGRG